MGFLQALSSRVDSEKGARGYPILTIAAIAFVGLVVYQAVRVVQYVASFIRVKSLLRGLPGPSPSSWIAGNLPELYHRDNLAWHHGVTKTYDGAGIVQFNAMFGDEQFYVTDPLALHHILIKQADIFEEPQFLLTLNQMTLGEGLLATIGPQHARQRKMLNPVFHIKHMRKQASVFYAVADKLCAALKSQISKADKHDAEVNMHAWLSRASLEFIAQGGLGCSLDALQENDDGNGSDREGREYARAIRELVPSTSPLQTLMQFLPLEYYLTRLLNLILPLRFIRTVYRKIVDSSALVSPTIAKVQEIVETLDRMGRHLVEERKREVAAGKEETEKDILSILVRANAEATEGDKLSDDEVVGQMTTLIFAATDTTASSVSRLLFTLAKFPDVQARLRNEIVQASRDMGRKPDEWTYDELMALPYLDAVVREGLRLWGPVSWIWRVARKETTLPLLRPITLSNGSAVSSVPLAKNQGVVVGITASNHDEATWGVDANEFRPERWLDVGSKDDDGKEDGVREKEGVAKARLPGAYSGMMTFSGGTRGCIGFKFALLAIKVDLTSLITNFAFSLPAPLDAEGREREVVWHMHHIQAPAMKVKTKAADGSSFIEDVVPGLPLMVSLISGDADE